MVLDFESLETPDPAHADVCVIGAGAAGILIATQVAEAGGTVTLLEGGGPQHEPRSQQIYKSQLTGRAHSGVHEGRFRTYGGTTTEWGGQILELDPEDFMPRAHVPGSGWPFAKQELTSYYERALRFEGLRRIERNNSEVWNELGLEPVDVGNEFQMLYSRWCPERNFTRLHERALTQTKRLTVHTHANVVGFELNESRTAIAAVRVRSFGGRESRVTAGSFVLCMGGIESTRLLLQEQAQGTMPWQTNGVLGQHFQDHIGMNGIPIRKIRQKPPWRYFGYVTSKGFRYHNKMQLRPELQTRLETLNVACTLGPVYKENKGRDRTLNLLRKMVRERARPSAAEALRMAFEMPGVAAHLLSQRCLGEAPEWKDMAIAVHCEQSPLGSSRIALSEERDELGLRRTELTWVISPEEIYSLRTFIRVAAEAFRREGFAEVEIPANFLEDDEVVLALCGDSNHHMGGTRMSSDPADGVVDANLRLHGVANGYVCSASVFPCSGFSNPTHTMLALAMRLADRLVAGLQFPASSCLNIVNSSSVSAAPTREIPLPGSGKSVPQLGFGCAYLLGPTIDRAASRRLLDAAWDAGIRHFDTARLYGQGRTEALLGEFLREHPDATVTTKFGMVPPSLPERVIEAAQRRIPGLPGPIRNFQRNSKAMFNAASARASLEHSLRELGREQVELFLLHEAMPAELVHDDLLEFLLEQRQAGRIGDFGIGGEYAVAPALAADRRPYTPVMQLEWSILGPALELPGSNRIHYRTFAKPADVLARRFAKDAALLARWSSIVDAELDEPLVLSRLLLKASLDAWPGSLTLFSTRREEHIFDNAAVAANDRLTLPARRLTELVRNELTQADAAPLFAGADAVPR